MNGSTLRVPMSLLWLQAYLKCNNTIGLGRAPRCYPLALAKCKFSQVKP